jgi:hypothetical protein
MMDRPIQSKSGDTKNQDDPSPEKWPKQEKSASIRNKTLGISINGKCHDYMYKEDYDPINNGK